MAPAPAVTYAALALQLLAAHSMAAVTTGLNLDTTDVVHERISERIADLIADVPVPQPLRKLHNGQ